MLSWLSTQKEFNLVWVIREGVVIWSGAYFRQMERSWGEAELKLDLEGRIHRSEWGDLSFHVGDEPDLAKWGQVRENMENLIEKFRVLWLKTESLCRLRVLWLKTESHCRLLSSEIQCVKNLRISSWRLQHTSSRDRGVDKAVDSCFP